MKPLEALHEYADALQFSSMGRKKREHVLAAIHELESVIAEMRERKVNNGRSTSPTLHAWAERLTARKP